MAILPNRYWRLAELVQLQRPRQIIEIGTWNGERAVELLAAGLAVRPDVHYIGFDLFEQANEASNAREMNVKPATPLAAVERRLEQFINCYPNPPYFASMQLIPGDTRKTLEGVEPPFPWADTFVFLDGGHSVETIGSDYQNVKKAAVIAFDDYYTPDDRGGFIDIDQFGCNRIVDAIGGFYLLPERDPVAGGGTVQMAVLRQ